jgi:hypothetical protein
LHKCRVRLQVRLKQTKNRSNSLGLKQGMEGLLKPPLNL